MSRVTGINSSRSEIYDWNYRMNRLNDQIGERRFRRDEGFHGAEGSSPQRVNSGSRNLGYANDEERQVNNRRAYRVSDDMEQRYMHQRNRESRNAGYRRQFVERSRMYQIPNDEDRTRSDGRNHYQENGYMKTEFRKERRNDRHQYQDMDETGHREKEFGKGRNNDPNYYQEIDKTGYRETEFRKERRDNRSYYQEMDDETGYRETEFCNGKAVDGNGRAYPENIGFMNRGLHHPKTTLNYPAPIAQYIDRGSDFPQSNMQNQPGTSAWNTQVPSTVQYHLVEWEKEEKKPRKVWWYTTSRVISALLIISSLVSDWLQYMEMDDPIGELQDKVTDNFTSEKCAKKSKKDEASQFLYFTIAGTVLAALQLANIIYQIIQNHRIPIDTDIKTLDYIDERTEVFLVNTFIKFPQTFLIHRYEVNLCLVCGTGDLKKVKGLLNGLSSLASSVWRYVTHIKVSAGTSCSCCKRCTERCGNRIKSCLLGCRKCQLKSAFPCCFMHLICVCRCKPSILAESASYPTGFVAFLYGLRVVKYLCWINISGVIAFVFDFCIGSIWDVFF